MALTEDTALDTAVRGKAANPISTGVTVYAGGLAGVRPSTGGIVPYNDATDTLFAGGLVEHGTADAARDPLSDDARLDTSGRVLNNVAVAGYADATFFLRKVYATDDNTFTLTRPTADADVVGLAFGFVGAGRGNVLLLTPAEAALLRGSGAGLVRIDLLTIDLASLATANLVVSYPLRGHGRIVTLGFQTVVPTTDAIADATVLAAINGVNTVGTLVLGDTADAQPGAGDTAARGARRVVAVTAPNEYFDGDTLNLVGVLTNAYLDGAVTLFIEVEPH